MKPIRLIAMDMDGTLLNSHQQLSAHTVHTLQAASARGVKLAICSGRAAGDIALFTLKNGLNDCAVLSLNGTYCLKTPMGEPFVNCLLSADTAKECLQLLKENRTIFCAYMQNRLAVIGNERLEVPFVWSSHQDEPGAPECVFGWDALGRLLPGGINKILLIEQDDAAMQKLRRGLETLSGLDITSSWPQDLELMPKGFGKGNAVEALAQTLGLTADEVMAVGDYDNDLSMIEYAGLGVAMGNATRRVKAAAQYVTLTNDEDGVAAAISRFVLE